MNHGASWYDKSLLKLPAQVSNMWSLVIFKETCAYKWQHHSLYSLCILFGYSKCTSWFLLAFVTFFQQKYPHYEVDDVATSEPRHRIVAVGSTRVDAILTKAFNVGRA